MAMLTPPKTDSLIDHPQTVEALLAAGCAIGAKPVSEHGGPPVLLIPEKYKVLELEVPPERIGRNAVFSDVDSFCNYVNRFITPGTLLFAEVTDTNCTVTAHIDHHNEASLEGGARERLWSSHHAMLACEPTREWRKWMSRNGSEKPFSQTEFALFLEDNETLFRSPSGADLLELVQTLEGKSNVRFNSAVRLTNGRSKLDYEEDVELRGSMGTTAGALEVPSLLICGITPFENGPEPYTVRARLRYRIQNKGIVFWYETISPHLILRDAAKAVLDRVREQVKAPMFIGRV